MRANLSLRPVADADAELNFRIYASTRAAEMAVVPWSEADKDAFLRQQFNAQKTYYDSTFTDATFDLLLLDETVVIGRLYVERRDDEIRLIDIALLPEYRGQGYGGQLLRELLDDAQRQRLPLRIHVEMNNPAMRLYERLGFEKVEEQGVYHLMQWTPIEETA